MRDPSIAGHFVCAALVGAQRRGAPIEAWLSEAGIPMSVLEEPRARVSSEQYARLIQLIWQGLDDELLGFGERRLPYGSFALVCQSMIRCRTLGQALKRALHVYRLLQAPVGLQLQREGDQASLLGDTQALLDPDHYVTESLLVIWHRTASWLIGQRIALTEVRLDYAAPPHHAEYRLLFGAPVTFEADATALCFPARYLDAPLLQDENSLRIFLERSPYDLLSRPERGNTLVASIRRMLAQTGSDLDADTAASQLAMSPQTLRRRLHEEGVSFQTLKDHWRRDLAINLLSDSTLPLAEIAQRTGFSEPSALHRAFKKWTGLSPGAYREHAPKRAES